MKRYSLLSAFFFLFLSSLTVFSQERLQVNQSTKFVLKNNDRKLLTVNLNEGVFTELSWEYAGGGYPKFTMISPSGKSITEQFLADESLAFVTEEAGEYKITFELNDPENKNDTEVTLKYSDSFRLSKTAKLKKLKKINGYDVKIYNVADDKLDYGSYLLIEKAGKLKQFMKSDSLVGGGLEFAEDSDYVKSARLMKATPDKTGDGTPDIAVRYYSGGAHCCTSLHFFELGKEGVRAVNIIYGGDSDVIALKKNPQGGLVLQTGDSTFAYWMTSFAGSPIPTVLLTFRDGQFRPDAKLMKKAAPSATLLKQKAAKAKKEFNLEPYEGSENGDFLDAFWGEMLDLMYSGNEKSAWEYLDLVWDPRKEGKERFKADFLKQLNQSKFWQMLQEDTK